MSVPTSWSYTVPLVASWARARSNGKRRFTAPKHAAALEAHRLHALAARPRDWRTDGVYSVSVHYAPPDGRRRDADRVLSLVLDACKGVAWDDDSDRYIGAQHVARIAADCLTPGGSTTVAITRIGDAPVKAARKRGAR